MNNRSRFSRQSWLTDALGKQRSRKRPSKSLLTLFPRLSSPYTLSQRLMKSPNLMRKRRKSFLIHC